MVSDKPVVNQPLWEKIPKELRDIPRWVVWNYEKKPNGKWDKPPKQLSGYNADPNTAWHRTTYENAQKAVMDGRFDGLGFVFDNDYTGIDLDDCIVDGEFSPIAQDFIALGSYTEISPSGTGIKAWFHGAKPEWNRKFADKEIYCKTRYFTVTGNSLNDETILPTDAKFENVVGRYFGNLYAAPEKDFADIFGQEWATPNSDIEKAKNALLSIPPEIAEERASWIAVGLACKATSRELKEAWIDWSETAPTKFVSREDCEKTWYSLRPRGDIGVGTLIRYAAGNMADNRIIDFCDLEKEYATLRPIQIADILRKGEVANIISAAKIGKSFLVGDLALATATGGKWLGKQVTKGRVLVVDYELHPETLISRYNRIKATRGVQLDRETLRVLPLRGQDNADLLELDRIVSLIDKNYYSLIIVDALYRIIPDGVSENDNSGMLKVYNQIDRFAAKTGASWVIVHHSSKGDQSGKSTVDMGSGAGSINRAVDSVIAIKEHETPNYAVCEVKNRSFASIDPFSIRFDYPCWYVASEVEATVKSQKGRKKTETDGAEERILAELRGAGEAVAQSLVVEVSGLPRESCRRLLYDMLDRQVIAKEEKNGRIFWKDPILELF